jgi:predicted nucleic acid-binding protein
VTLTDASFLIALIDQGDPYHQICRTWAAQVRPPLVTTWPCFTEAMHLLRRGGGWSAQSYLWSYVEAGTIVFHFNNPVEQLRMQSLMAQYQDLPMDLADASLVAAAETRQETEICTLDRDFYIYRLPNGRTFSVMPNLLT